LVIKALHPDCIRLGFQPQTLDLDPDQMNTDPKPCFFCSHKVHKTKKIIFEMLKKKIWSNFQRIKEFFNQKDVTRLSKIWVLGSEIQKKPIPGVKNGTGSRIRDPQHCKIFTDPDLGGPPPGTDPSLEH
jgi:hypothetical protein